MSAKKVKGCALERWVSERLNENEIPAERTPLSGMIGGKYGNDVITGTRDNIVDSIECKNRESNPIRFWEWIEDDDFLVLKRNRKKPLVVMEFDRFIDLYKIYWQSRNE